ncbi:MAG: S41 family peptidase [Bacteroidetes bacterium]|jgi:carboxyl-terminal processing protease|nr:S41 family peptidase [Bacteroidota bacterium]MBT5530514.1 S41 family peptidase [Cytophagia bacterium]MBT3424047.1 S41 family peptidase [Bacteroidota bacterium]MBT3801453.1 S41 family peptidase [Bacteroidota bacterium]MBT4337904.1 S41 family peptidase [Bacteroidota bacterium]
MNKKTQILLPFLFALMVAFGMYLGKRFHPYPYQNKLTEVLNKIDETYVDTIQEDKLINETILKLLQDLDPHSYYIDAADVAAVEQDLDGNFEGIGIEFNILRDTIIVVSPISGGPSEALGIQAGDKFIYIDDEVVAGIGIQNADVRNKLLGKKGSKVNVKLKRNGESDLLDFTITRDKIPLFSIDASYMVNEDIGYIKINRFSATTFDEFKESLYKLEKEGMQSLIVDLSGNPGGYLKAAYDITNQFFSSKKLIVYTEGRMRKRRNYFSNGRGDFTSGKLVVLIDEGSASASEILAGAVQDWDRAIIIGRKTFGKALVQEEFVLSDQSKIRLTVARYYTPMGRFIQKPYDTGTDDYYMEMYERYANGEVYSADSVHFNDSLKFTSANGRIMYGGGGIMPDIFVAIDSSGNTYYLNQLIRSGSFSSFVLQYVDNNRPLLLNKYPDFKAFNTYFSANSVLKEFNVHAKKTGVEYREDEFNKSKDIILNQIKALIARQLYEAEAYYKVFNQMNNKYQKAVEVLQSDKFDELEINSKQ